MDDKVRCFGEAFRTLRPGGRLVVCAWLANSTPHPWQVRHLLKPICQEGRLPGLGDEGEYVDLLRRTGFAVSSVEDVSAAVARTWSVCVRRAVRKFAADSQYRRFLLHGNARDRIFAVTLFRMLLAYRTGAMRYVGTDCQQGNRLRGRGPDGRSNDEPKSTTGALTIIEPPAPAPLVVPTMVAWVKPQ